MPRETDRLPLRRLLRPGWVLTHVLVIAIAVTFVSLGLWQLRRHAEQAAANEVLEQRLQDDPVALADGLATDDPDLVPVHLIGTFTEDPPIRLSPRSRNERPGYEVLAPLRTDDLDGAEHVVLVNRGWMPLEAEVPAAPRGEVTLTGRLRLPRDSRQVLSDDDGTVTLLSSVDLAALSEQVDRLETRAYVEVIDEDARAAGALPRPADPPKPDAGPHLSYAAQWFAFTVIGLVGYPLLLRRRLLDSARRPSRRVEAPVGSK